MVTFSILYIEKEFGILMKSVTWDGNVREAY